MSCIFRIVLLFTNIRRVDDGVRGRIAQEKAHRNNDIAGTVGVVYAKQFDGDGLRIRDAHLSGLRSDLIASGCRARNGPDARSDRG